jgi:pimeloyl-ACP methyl ester carboxylesterase
MRDSGAREADASRSLDTISNPSTAAYGLHTPAYWVEGSGPLLIYIAGLDGTGRLFFKQAGALARSYRVVTFRSRDDASFTYDDLSGDVARIIRDQGERRAVILGESFGGTVALNFALRHPEMVERLVVINSFPRFPSRFKIRLAAWLAAILPFPLILPARLASSRLGLFLDGVNREDRRQFFEAFRSVSGPAYARRLRLIADLDLESRLSEISAPTIFIAGEKDLLIPSAREAHRMAARMPNATLKIIKGAGHACLLGSRVRLAEILAD